MGRKLFPAGPWGPGRARAAQRRGENGKHAALPGRANCAVPAEGEKTVAGRRSAAGPANVQAATARRTGSFAGSDLRPPPQLRRRTALFCLLPAGCQSHLHAKGGGFLPLAHSDGPPWKRRAGVLRCGPRLSLPHGVGGCVFAFLDAGAAPKYNGTKWPRGPGPRGAERKGSEEKG